jgi:hypothetical protein
MNARRPPGARSFANRKTEVLDVCATLFRGIVRDRPHVVRGLCGNARAVTITIGGVQVSQNVMILNFAAQNNPNGLAWDTTAGTLRLDLTAGPVDQFGQPTTSIATLTLTGVNGNPFEIIYDPVGGVGSNVSIALNSARLPGGVLGFPPIPRPASESAHLNGVTVSNVNFNRGNGVKLNAMAFGTGPIGSIGPFDMKGNFNGDVGPILDNGLRVTRLAGRLSFDFAGMKAGDKVSFANTVVVRAEIPVVFVPEPGTFVISSLIATTVLLGCAGRKGRSNLVAKNAVP